MKKDKILEIVKINFLEHKNILDTFNKTEIKKIIDISNIIINSIEKNGKIIWCGNGGSASDSQHLAAELIGRFKSNRKPLKSISLNSDTSVITCIANDFGYENIFSRQIEALANKNDTLIVISTSGNSQNIINAVKIAKKMRIKVIGLLGKGGGYCKKILNKYLIVNSNNTARIQEMHILIGHILCEIIENKYGIKQNSE